MSNMNRVVRMLIGRVNRRSASLQERHGFAATLSRFPHSPGPRGSFARWPFGPRYTWMKTAFHRPDARTALDLFAGPLCAFPALCPP